jgi:hypothetical protein
MQRFDALFFRVTVKCDSSLDRHAVALHRTADDDLINHKILEGAGYAKTYPHRFDARWNK